MQGLPCTLTSSGDGGDGADIQGRACRPQGGLHAPATTKCACIGQQTASKRYVVEFQCPEQPKGLVAFIPLNGNTAPFETLDCAAAAKKGAACKLTAN